ncbi:MAG: HAMP domain-containing histidine kinase [Polyangiaceae bacterium]|nr:HAMP domain-containing histidine kinase [Polyangiaceae bacterium]
MSLRRDVAAFLAAALIPAGALGWLGLRALRNEEAALRREAALEVAGESERARRIAEQALEKAARELEAVPVDDVRADDPASLSRVLGPVLDLSPPFVEAVVVTSEGRVLAPRAPSEPSRAEADERCSGALDRLTGPDRDEARSTLLGCPEARDTSGRWVWPVIAIGEIDRGAGNPALGAEVASFFESHAASMRLQERKAARDELAASRRLSVADRSRAVRALDAADSGGRWPVVALASAWRSDAALRALSGGAGTRRFEGPGTVGVARSIGDGVFLGLVATPETVARALADKPPFIETRPGLVIDVVTEASASGTDAVESVSLLSEGLGFRVRLADPAALREKSTRSTRVLGVLVAGSAGLAVALATLLFLRMRAARRTSELRTSFVASVSHELRTPIASVRMLSELLADGKIEEAERSEVAEALVREARRMGDTVERFLSYARMEKGKLVARKTKEDVALLVRERVTAFQARHPGVEVILEVPDALSAEVDRAQIELVVDNLLENANKYAPKGQPYEISLREEGNALLLSVSDRGPGVPRALRSTIWRPFERGDARLSAATEGTGLGLALVRAAAEAHGGEAILEDSSGPGATFTVRLPRGAIVGEAS